MARTSLPRVTHALAERHESVWLRLTALQAQVAATATRRPAAPVAAETARVAEALLAGAAPFLSGGGRLPAAAPDHGGLATQLGQALAEMASWEATNAHWRDDLKAFVWAVRDATPLPVRRLRPKLAAPASRGADTNAAKMAVLREKLARRIDEFRRR